VRVELRALKVNGKRRNGILEAQMRGGKENEELDLKTSNPS